MGGSADKHHHFEAGGALQPPTHGSFAPAEPVSDVYWGSTRGDGIRRAIILLGRTGLVAATFVVRELAAAAA